MRIIKKLECRKIIDVILKIKMLSKVIYNPKKIKSNFIKKCV